MGDNISDALISSSMSRCFDICCSAIFVSAEPVGCDIEEFGCCDSAEFGMFTSSCESSMTSSLHSGLSSSGGHEMCGIVVAARSTCEVLAGVGIDAPTAVGLEARRLILMIQRKDRKKQRRENYMLIIGGVEQFQDVVVR